MLAVLVLSFGLAMDAVAVALVRGASGPRRPANRLLCSLELGLAFGLAQGLMPLAGWGLGTAFAGLIESFDHWLAFALLAVLGARMLAQAASPGEADPPPAARGSHYLGLAAAAFATSVDAAAAGLALPLLQVPVAAACLIIGGVTALLCAPAYWLGARASSRGGKLAEALGGTVLIAIGAKILIEHLAA